MQEDETDEQMARRLQSEFDAVLNPRASRGSRAAPKKVKKKKRAGEEGEDGERKKRRANPNSAFNKEMILRCV